MNNASIQPEEKNNNILDWIQHQAQNMNIFNDAISKTDLNNSSVDRMAFKKCTVIIKRNWKELMQCKKEIGLQIYKAVLFKEVRLSRLFLNTNIESQTDSFMTMMDYVVRYLENQQTFDMKLKKLGELHASRYGVKSEHFKYFKSAFLSVIKLYIPWTETREHAWHWFWSRIILNMSHSTQASIMFNTGLHPQEVEKRVILVHGTFDIALNSYAQTFSNAFYADLIHDEPDIGELFSDVSQKYQAAKFLSMFKHTMRLMDDMETFESQLSFLAGKHVQYGVRIEHLSAFGRVLIENVKKFNLKYVLEMSVVNVPFSDSGIMLSANSSNDSILFVDTDSPLTDYGSGTDDLDLALSFADAAVAHNMKFAIAPIEWTNEHKIAWQWLWKIVVNIFSAQLVTTGKNNSEYKSDGNAESNNNNTGGKSHELQ